MRNQFFYTIEHQQGDQTFKILASFNPDYVIRSIEPSPGSGKLVILLDDFHEAVVPTQTMEKNKVVTKNIKQNINSEIYLNEADSRRYKEMHQLDNSPNFPSAEEMWKTNNAKDPVQMIEEKVVDTETATGETTTSEGSSIIMPESVL